MSDEERLINEEKKMIGFMADRLWDIMVSNEFYHYFKDRERDTVNCIRNHFADNYTQRLMPEKDEGRWDKTK